ncbi:MAG: lysophospholipid acyltransferase family protein [Planctomycetota bacterium]
MPTSVTAAIARLLVTVLAMTWRIHTSGKNHAIRLRRAGAPIIFAMWHGQLLPLLWHHRGDQATLVISAHTDGSYLARTAARWGYRVVHGSSTRGGVRVLKRMIRILGAGGEVALTPDGPRGPAGVAKPGAVAVAQWTGVAILPVGATASAFWRMASWDGFVIPKPFARIRIVYGAPLIVAEGRAERDAANEKLQAGLNALSQPVAC